MAKKIEEPLADWPHTTFDDGRAYITGTYPKPRFETHASMFTGLIAVMMAGFATIGSGNPMIGLFMLGAFIAIYYLFFKKALLGIFGGSLNIAVGGDEISVGSTFGQKHYSRDLRTEFRIEQHSKALTERGKDTTYRDAIEVVMHYGEKRVPLAAMPQKEMELARALVLRLQNVCNATRAMKNGQRAGAKESDFGRAPDLG
ncbi:MAG: hypothetical protein AB7S70_00375 [Hyphomicrobium sp.]|uniref:hypothetical protein n=1 Tax=Hyphomicrobium sp. TaxID=82 RepID=UPI003D0BEF66